MWLHILWLYWFISESRYYRNKTKQVLSEQRDLWGKYNDAGEMITNFMINDAREKEQIKETIKDVELKETQRWLEYWKDKAQSVD